MKFSIVLPVHRAERKKTHGDYFFGQSLANALIRQSHSAQVLAGTEIDKVAPDDIVILIRGKRPLSHRIGRINLVWCISFFPKPAQPDYEFADHIFAASPFLRNRIARILGEEKTSLMYQAFDADLMFPTAQPYENDLVFVGTRRTDDRRPAVSFAAQSSARFRLWGPGWEESDYKEYHVANHVPNQDLGEIYRGGAAIVNDHLTIMRRNQICSNRVFDALACGKAVLTDSHEGLPPDFANYLYFYHDAESFAQVARTALSEPQEMKIKRSQFAKSLRQIHSFDQRAQQLLETIDRIDQVV